MINISKIMIIIIVVTLYYIINYLFLHLADGSSDEVECDYRELNHVKGNHHRRGTGT